MEAIVTLLAGGIVTWSLVLRYQTVNTPEFTENIRVTIGIFFSFALGFLMLNPQKVEQIKHILNHSYILSLLFIISPLFIISIFQALKGYQFSYIFNFQRITNLFDWFLDNLILILITLFLISLIYVESKYKNQIIIDNLVFFLWILAFSLFLGFIHSLLGTIIAGINISMVLAHFFIDGAFGASLGTVFDFLEMIGISSTPVKWGLVVMSTALGVHSWVSFDDMVDGIRHLISP